MSGARGGGARAGGGVRTPWTTKCELVVQISLKQKSRGKLLTVDWPEQREQQAPSSSINVVNTSFKSNFVSRSSRPFVRFEIERRWNTEYKIRNKMSNRSELEGNSSLSRWERTSLI